MGDTFLPPVPALRFGVSRQEYETTHISVNYNISVSDILDVLEHGI